MISLTSETCLSGGADGADLCWGTNASNAGFEVCHFTFRGHRTLAPQTEIVVLQDDQLRVADPFLIKANKTLKRRFPGKNEHVNNLLRRNYYQVAWSDSVYAVATIEDGLVTGGTSWAVQMFLDRGQSDVYVFDQNDQKWYTWDGGWSEIDTPPYPSGIWAGIGSRNLTVPGKNAIRDLLSI